MTDRTPDAGRGRARQDAGCIRAGQRSRLLVVEGGELARERGLRLNRDRAESKGSCLLGLDELGRGRVDGEEQRSARARAKGVLQQTREHRVAVRHVLVALGEAVDHLAQREEREVGRLRLLGD